MKLKTASEFITFFEAIPEEKWCVGTMKSKDGRSCALGHIPVQYNESAVRLIRLGRSVGYGITAINDYPSSKFPQESPKQRVLAALRLIASTP